MLRPDMSPNTTYNVVSINGGTAPQNGRATYEGVRTQSSGHAYFDDVIRDRHLTYSTPLGWRLMFR